MYDSQPGCERGCEMVRGWCDMGARGGARGVLSEVMAHKPRAGKASWTHICRVVAQYQLKFSVWVCLV